MTCFELISFGAKNEENCLYQKGKAKGERGVLVFHVSSSERDVIKTLHVLVARSLARSVSEVGPSPSGCDSFVLIRKANAPTSNGSSTQSLVPRPRSRDAIPILHLLNSPPDDFPRRFPIRDGPNYPVDEDGDSVLADPESPSEASLWSEEVEPYDPYVGVTDSTFDGFFDTLETLTFGHAIMQPNGLPHGAAMMPLSNNAMSQALEPRALEVRQALSNTASNFGSNLPEAQEMLQLGPAIEQINGGEIDYLVNLYFENYHRHCPILHRPSFQPTLCPPALLLSIMALGGMYAPEQIRIQRMRCLLDVIEAYIFSLAGLRDEYMTSLKLSEAPDGATLQFQFELFQGAYLIIIAQYFSGNVAAKRRARRQRYTRVLDVSICCQMNASY